MEFQRCITLAFYKPNHGMFVSLVMMYNYSMSAICHTIKIILYDMWPFENMHNFTGGCTVL